MTQTFYRSGLFVVAAAAGLLSWGATTRLAGQETTPTKREFTLNAREYRFSPDRVEVSQDDLVKLTIVSGDVAYGFTLDEYRLSRRVPAGGSTTVEFHANRPGTFTFYSNLTNDPRHAQMRGQLTVGRH
jgi:heme/copper-type cytochrome/quinol oxidase subunit 2